MVYLVSCFSMLYCSMAVVIGCFCKKTMDLDIANVLSQFRYLLSIIACYSTHSS